MRSPEEIARRAADALVSVERYHVSNTFFVSIADGSFDGLLGDKEPIEAAAAAARQVIAAAVLAALREMLAPPAPGGIDAARLAEIRRRDALVMPAEDAPSLFGYQPESRDAFRDRRALLAAYDHVAGVLRAIGDGELAAYCSGHDEGKRAGEATARDRAVFLTRALQKIATYEAAHCDDPTASAAWEIATEALEAADAPLADPEVPAG